MPGDGTAATVPHLGVQERFARGALLGQLALRFDFGLTVAVALPPLGTRLGELGLPGRLLGLEDVPPLPLRSTRSSWASRLASFGDRMLAFLN